MPAAPTTPTTATATRIQTTRSHKPLSGQVKIPQIFAANQLASKNLTPSCSASPFPSPSPVPRGRFTLSPFDIWPKPSHPPCRIAFLSPFFAVYFWHPLVRFGLVWFGLVAAKTESAAIYFIATLASAAIASADVAATATAAARLVQVDSSTWRGLHAQ